MARLHLPRSLVALFPGAPRHLDLEAGDLEGLIAALDERYPGMRDRLCEPGPRLRPHINAWVDGQPASLTTPLTTASVVHILPAVSGGAPMPGPEVDGPATRPCVSCATHNPATARFCNGCGERLVTACPSCGDENPQTARFCSACGTALPGTVARGGGEPASAPSAEPGVDGHALAAERRHVSVLFADLVGFTNLAQDRDPEAVRELLARYFETCRDIIERYGGTVETFIGDAVMAVWGAPVAREDDPERAVRAALDLVAAVRSLGSDGSGGPLAARAGVLSGDAAVPRAWSPPSWVVTSSCGS